MLTCKEITELVTDYAEGNLSFMDRVRFQMHIGMCRNCRRYVRQVKATASRARHAASAGDVSGPGAGAPAAVRELEADAQAPDGHPRPRADEPRLRSRAADGRARPGRRSASSCRTHGSRSSTCGRMEDAERLGFRGSPTVLVDGADIEPVPPGGVGLG